MYYTYFLTFLVQVVKISPEFAGVVIFISIAWDAITDPILGNISDRPGVNKQKLMLKSVLPMCVLFVLAWAPFGKGLPGDFTKILVYTLISIGLWLFYTIYTIPYYSVIAELTEDTFDITFDKKDANGIFTVGDAIEMIRRKMENE